VDLDLERIVKKGAGKDMEIAHMVIVDVRSLEEQGSTQSGLVVFQVAGVLDLMANSKGGSDALVLLGSLVVGDMDTQQRTSVEVDALEDEVIRSLDRELRRVCWRPHLQSLRGTCLWLGRCFAVVGPWMAALEASRGFSQSS
jgi:hypothetical protein